MGACLGIDTFVREAKTLHGLAVEQVRLDNFVDILQAHESVPDSFRVDDNGDAVFALIEAAGGVDADGTSKTGSFGGVFEGLTNCGGILGRATPFGMIRRALVGADENVTFKRRHQVYPIRAGLIRKPIRENRAVMLAALEKICGNHNLVPGL